MNEAELLKLDFEAVKGLSSKPTKKFEILEAQVKVSKKNRKFLKSLVRQNSLTVNYAILKTITYVAHRSLPEIFALLFPEIKFKGSSIEDSRWPMLGFNQKLDTREAMTRFCDLSPILKFSSDTILNRVLDTFRKQHLPSHFINNVLYDSAQDRMKSNDALLPAPKSIDTAGQALRDEAQELYIKGQKALDEAQKLLDKVSSKTSGSDLEPSSDSKPKTALTSKLESDIDEDSSAETESEEKPEKITRFIDDFANEPDYRREDSDYSSNSHQIAPV